MPTNPWKEQIFIKIRNVTNRRILIYVMMCVLEVEPSTLDGPVEFVVSIAVFKVI